MRFLFMWNRVGMQLSACMMASSDWGPVHFGQCLLRLGCMSMCLCVCVSVFPQAGTSARRIWAVVLEGLRETGATITLNHSFASLASAPVEKCFKKQNK